MQISVHIFYFILLNFVLFFWDFNGSSSKKENLKMFVLKSEEKMIENVRGSYDFS